MGSPHHTELLVYVDDCGSHGQVLRNGVMKLSGVDSGVPVVPNHFQQGYGCSDEKLGLTGVMRCGRSRLVGEGGALLCHLLLHVIWSVNVH